MKPLKSFAGCARAVAAGCLMALLASSSAVGEPMTPGQTEAIEKIVHDYLLKNPEIIFDALETYKERQRLAEIAAVRKTLAERKNDLRHDPGSPTAGDPAGDVVVIEFFDYRCSVCKRVHPIVAELMQTDKKIRRVYKEWPILGPESVFAARAALASRRQGKYLAFHNALMNAKRALTRVSVVKIAETVGIDSERLEKDMEDPEIVAIHRRNYELAKELRLTGTPSFVIGDELLRGGRDLEGLRAIVDRQRQQG